MSSDNNTHYVGKIVSAVSAKFDEKFTEPPARYTEDSLMADMLAAHKFAKTDADREILKEVGLGTARTREPAITGQIKKEMLIRRKKGKKYEITSSDAAKTLVGALPESLISVTTTAKWELVFKMVERGETTPDKVRVYLKKSLTDLMKIAQESKGKLVLSIGNSNKKLASSGRVTNTKDIFAKKAPTGTPPKGAPAKPAASGVGGLAAAAAKTIKKWY
jgi:DNA topoisomerase IA